MIIYGNSLSPFVRKVMIFAAEKGLQFEVKQTTPGGDDPDFRAISPFGKIPGFRDGDFLLCDSSAIVHYLEAKYPTPALIPADPQARGRAIWYEEFADTILSPTGGKIFFNRIVAKLLGREGDPAVADAAQAEELPPVLDWLETQIPASGFLVGDAFSLADIAVGTMLVNLGHCGAAPDPARVPKVCAYQEGLFARPSFAPIIAVERRVLGLDKAA